MGKRGTVALRCRKLFALLCAAVLLSECLLTGALALPRSGLFQSQGKAFFSYTEIPLYIDNEYLGPSYIVDSVPYVPLLAFTECMLQDACETVWDQEAETATISSDALVLRLSMDERFMTANDRYFYLGDSVYNINGTIIIPLQVAAGIFSLSLHLNEEQWSIRIDTGNIELPAPAKDVYDETDLYWLSRVIYAEAANQPLEGMMGVGNVVMNRVADCSGLFENTVSGVIFQDGQFDVVRMGTIYQEPSEQAVIAAKLCMEGFSTVGNSKWFVNPAIGKVNWFDWNKTHVATIADHAFYC